MKKYFDSTIDWEQFAALNTGLSRQSAGFEPKKVRSTAQKKDSFNAANLRRYLFRPYDARWCYYTNVPNVWKRSRPDLGKQSWAGNAFLLSRAAGVAEPEGQPMLFATTLMARDCMRGHAIAFPLRVRSATVENSDGELPSLPDKDVTIANLSPAARTYLASLGITNPDADAETATLIWMHALAIGYSPAYLSENADGIRQDWPRIPLPKTRATLLASAALGKQIAALLDSEQPVEGVTTGAIRPELKTIAVIARVGGGQLKAAAGDLDVTAGWGHAGKGGVTMPGKGKIVEHVGAIHESPLRGKTYDVYLNDVAYWQNIPSKVWDYTIGGYQVIKKWLSYRERELLGRSLTADEVREVTNIARRIAATVLLEPALDANYKAVKKSAYAWPVK